ncbi:MAG: bifunctional response regulator/alkaline phosphatase family protein [candidate division Zixibacteria bacterium]|jgi:CheY-like chemotaxis protein|nr:bifunctional response regulator/alkaline phosphatase family protein [candidate division Zixibacteria bacterium]
MPIPSDKKRILWVDDEIDSLKPHLLFLEKKGFSVTPAMSGDDAIVAVRDGNFDLVLLDEMMPGKDGLTTLEEIKDLRPHLPVVMVTKSEEESLMEDAIGSKIDDYLVKPVNPSQILLVIKRLLDAKKIISSSSMRRYVTEINKFNQKMYGPMQPDDWHEAARLLAEWDLELDNSNDDGLKETHTGTKREWNTEFTKYILNTYQSWLSGDDRPLMSPDIVARFVAPPLKSRRQVLFVVVDCMRLDQWMLVEPLMSEFFNIERSYYFSILPTATPFARNAVFAGMFPDEISRIYPDNYQVQDEGSLNRYEDRMFADNLARLGIRFDRPMRYVKVYNNTEGEELVRRAGDYFESPAVTFVFNFLDILAHGRSNNVILKEIAGTDAAFRSLMRSWFVHSPLFALLKQFAERDFTVIVTSDHGSVLCQRGTMAHGRRTTSTNLRYKYGDNLKSDPKDSVLIKKPKEWRLPMFSLATTFIIAKEDYYFVYPNNYNEMVRQFQNSFQHGGISLEEMVVPVAVMTPK